MQNENNHTHTPVLQAHRLPQLSTGGALLSVQTVAVLCHGGGFPTQVIDLPSLSFWQRTIPLQLNLLRLCVLSVYQSAIVKLVNNTANRAKVDIAIFYCFNFKVSC
jgi:hypothetical protein